MGSIFKSNIFQLLTSRVAIQISTILQSIIIARVLGPENKGFYTQVMIYPTIVGSIVMLGCCTGIVKLAAASNINLKYNVSITILQVTFALGVIGSLIAAIINGLFFSPDQSFYHCSIAYGIFVLIYVMNRGLSAYYNGRGELGLFSVASVILYPIYFLFVLILFVLNELTVSSALYSLLAANLVSLLFLIVTNKDLKLKKAHYSRSKLVRYSSKFILADLSEPIYSYYDKAILAFFLSPFLFGIYTIASSTASLISIFSNTFSIKVFSDVANKRKQDITQFIRVNIICMLISAIVLAVCIPILIPLFYGNEYEKGIVPTIILLAGCMIQGQSYVLERAILANGLPYVGISAKLIGMLSFGMLLVAFSLLSCKTIEIAALCSVITSLTYFYYIQVKAKQIFNISTSLFPNMETIKTMVNQFEKIIKK